MNKQNLSQLREELSQIDNQLLDLLNQRWQRLNAIQQQKQQKNLPLRDEKREKEVLNKLQNQAEKNHYLLSNEDICLIFSCIMTRALDYQQNLK